MDHQVAVVETVLGLGIQRRKVILRFAFAGHHTDIVTAHQRIQPGNPGQRRFGCDQPELGFGTQCILQIAFNADSDGDFIQVLAQADVLYRTNFDALITHGRSSGDDAVGGDEVDSHGCASLFVSGPDKPSGNQHCNDRQ